MIARPSGELLKRYLEETGRAGQQETYIFSSQTHPQMTISCIEEIYKKISPSQGRRIPEMFLEKSYTPHTMRHTTATHMLEAGVPIVAIKISSVIPQFPQRNGMLNFHRNCEQAYPGLEREMVFSSKENHANHQKENPLPDFLK